MKTVWLLEGHTPYDGDYVEAVFAEKPSVEALTMSAVLMPKQANELLEKGCVEVWLNTAVGYSLYEMELK